MKNTVSDLEKHPSVKSVYLYKRITKKIQGVFLKVFSFSPWNIYIFESTT